jgi:hypothetical protein
MDEDTLTRMNDGERRDRVLGEFGASTLDNGDPIKGDQVMKLLSEMNSLTDEHERFLKYLISGVDTQ